MTYESFIPHKKLWVSRICQVLAALIMLQTLYFKFTANEESVHIFTAIGMEPWGRIGIGILELIASILLFIPSTVWIGASMGMGLMAGALYFHCAKIGICVEMDHGYLFILALVVFLSSAIILYIRKSEIPYINKLNW